MKKKSFSAIAVICLAAALLIPGVSRAAMSQTPHFMAVNDKLLPYNTETMPYVVGSVYYVPYEIFGEAKVWSAAAEELDRICMYRGDVIVDFHVGRGVTEDRNGNILQWPAARRIGNRFYVPLRNVCEYFGLTYEILDIGRDIIPQEQMRLIRIRSATGTDGLNNATFMGMNTDVIRNYYNAYFTPAPPVTVSPPSQGETPSPPPTLEPPPTYQGVTIHHSFYNISSGGVDVILELLDAIAAPAYRFCFFVSAEDIIQNAALIRRIAGSGHAIGVWLTEGTYDEYLLTSALLYEAAKVKTLLVSADNELETVSVEAVGADRIIYWETMQSLIYDDTLSVIEVTDMLPQESGARQNLISSCSENTALMLSGILSYLREHEYSIVGITETIRPIRNSEFGTRSSE